MSLFRQTIKQAATAFLPSQFWLVRRPASLREIALTFDDGPHPEYTPRVLDQLAAAQARATFFVVGECAERYPELIQRIVAEGHTLGNHTWSHSEPATTNWDQLSGEVCRTRQLLLDLTGQTIDQFRPPKGQLTARKTVGLWGLRQQIVLWSADPKDYRDGCAEEMADWAHTFVPRPGEIILLHDAFPNAIPHLTSFIARCRDEHGLSCTPLS